MHVVHISKSAHMREREREESEIVGNKESLGCMGGMKSGGAVE